MPKHFVFSPKKGEKRCQRIVMGESADRHRITLSLFSIYGVKPGPILLLNAAVHGNEVVGVEIIRKLVDTIMPEELSGNVIAVPIVNPLAFNSGDRWDPYDRQDMNRVFPGNPKGTMTERIAHYFFEYIVSKANYILDIHSAEFPDEMLPHVRMRISKPSAEYLKLVTATGIEVIWKGPTIDGMLQTEAKKKNIPCATIEIGAAGLISQNNLNVGLQAAENVMKVLGMIKGIPKIPERQIIVESDEAWVRSPIGGIFKPDVDLGQIVKIRQKIGDLIDPTSFKESDIFSPANGLITGITRQSIVRSGTRLILLSNFNHQRLAGVEG